jgi:hypothetical protein
MQRTIAIDRAPVLTLCAAVVAERLGFEWQEALTLGRAVAGLTAHSKGTRLRIAELRNLLSRSVQGRACLFSYQITLPVVSPSRART